MQNQKGNTYVILIAVIVVLLVVAGFFAYQYFTPKPNTQPQVQNNQQNQTDQTVQPTITVTAPNGGEQWQAGSKQVVGWTSQNIDANTSINIALWDSNNNPIIIAKSLINDGIEEITVPNISDFKDIAVPPNNYKLMVSAVINGNSISDKSDNYFGIVASTSQTAGWKTYTNTQYGYEIKYPSDWSYSLSDGLTFYCDYPKRNYEPCTGLEGVGIGDINPGIKIGIEQKNLEDFKKDYVVRTQEDYILDNVRGAKIVGGPIIGMGVDYTIIFVTKNNVNYKIISPSNPPAIDNQIISTFKFTN
jgi:hypothetical protein